MSVVTTSDVGTISYNTGVSDGRKPLLMEVNFRTYQNGMHSHVDSAHTHQDTPAKSHTKAKQEGVLERGKKSKRKKKSQKVNRCLKHTKEFSLHFPQLFINSTGIVNVFFQRKSGF